MVTGMLEKAIEIEGLLRIIRDGKPMSETYTLLKRKAAEIADMAATLAEEGATPAAETPDADFIMAPPEQTSTKPEVFFINKELIQKDDPNMIATESPEDLKEEISGITAEDLGLEEEDDILLSFEDITEDLPKETTSEQSVRKQDETTDNQDKATPERKSHKKQQIKLKSAFSLNDRFLYARELFEGSMKMFDSTLDFIEGLDDFSIIEEYFYNELEWNREDSNVISFMERIRPLFI